MQEELTAEESLPNLHVLLEKLASVNARAEPAAASTRLRAAEDSFHCAVNALRQDLTGGQIVLVDLDNLRGRLDAIHTCMQETGRGQEVLKLSALLQRVKEEKEALKEAIDVVVEQLAAVEKQG